jgi:hypothetical protein
MLAAIAPLSEAERKKLSKAAVAIRKVLIQKPFDLFIHRRPEVFRLKLALFAVAPITETQRWRVWQVFTSINVRNEERDQLFQVLADRKPPWISQWVDKELEAEQADWQFVRRLVRANICPRPQSENYTLKMLRGVFSHDPKQSLKDRLLEDPALLRDEVWRIFELSPVRETILYPGDDDFVLRGDYPCFSWSRTLLELCQEGKLDRQRLLAASLGSLARNTAARNTAWFCKFHERLEPSVEERQRLQSSYLQLLSHPVPSVVGMALDALADLQKARLLDVSGLLEAVEPVFHVQPKAPPLAAVKLLGKSEAPKEHAPRLAPVLLAGLSHPAAQVQEAIIELLDKVRDRAGALIASALPEKIEHLAPSLQDRARQLLADETGALSTATSVTDAGPASDLIEQARQIPSPRREMAGIDSLLVALQGTGEISAVAFDPMAVPRLYPDQRVQPIGTLDELIERLTVAVEGLDDPIEFELLVDGLSRLCDQRPDNFQAHVAPLLLRIEKLLPPHPSAPLTLTAGGLRMAVFKLVLRWGDRDVRETHEERDSILGFLDVRLGHVAVRLRKRQAAPLLACPTHRPGWIDPREMAARLEAYQQLGQEPAKHDFIQGLLRLAPDARAEALASAAHLQGKYASAFRYALGGPLEDSSVPSAVLIAAGRARTPLAELTELQNLADVEGPDALHPAHYEWQVDHSSADSPKHWARLYIKVRPDTPAPEQIRNLPTTLIHRWKQNDFAWDGQTGLNRWKATVWPANLDSYFALGAKIHAGHYSQASLLRQRATFLGPLFDPDVPFSEMAQLHLALCLNEQAPEVTGLAVDALVELIRDGRCTGTELGAVCGKMIPYDFMKLNRLGKHLETAARASLLHAHVCGRIMQTACACLGEVRKDLHHLLEPLLEWLSALEQSVDLAVRPILEKLTSGKAGELARKLLAIRGTPNKRRPVLLEALQGRLERAGRWAN